MEDRPRFQTGPREIRPSGIIGGPREKWPGWNCAPTSHTERARMVTLHLYTGAPERYPTTKRRSTHPECRGASMRSRPVALLLADLRVTKTHSRPHVSNDNPFSESQFRTMKYRPEFPDRSLFGPGLA